MRICLINVIYSKGSTGNITKQLKDFYISRGNQVKVISRKAFSSDHDIALPVNGIESKIHHTLSNAFGNMYGGMKISTSKIIKEIKSFKPDVVHLHCINGYFINVYRLLNYLKKNRIKTILTNHADFMFTGGCGYALDCNRYLNNECKGCLNIRCIRKYSHQHYKKLQKIYDGFNTLKITNVSPFQNEKAKQSQLQKKLIHNCILNPIEERFFKGNDYNSFDTKNNILYVTPNFENPEKGGDFVYKIAEKLPEYHFYIISSIPSKKLIETDNVHIIKSIKNIDELCGYYQSADATLLLSKQETFSMVVAESLSCGTPVIGFKAGGPESIAIDEYSTFVEQGDIDGIVSAITNLKEIDRKDLIRKAKEKYNIEKIGNEYLNVYNSFDNKKKILHVVESFQLGGTESFILNYYEKLHDKGYQFDLYVSGIANDNQLERFKSLGGNVYFGINPSYKNRKKVIKEFLMFLQTHTYDVVHTDINFDGEAYLVAAKKAGVPIRVCHSHDDVKNVNFSLKKKIQYSFQRQSIKRNANRFAACSVEAGESIFGKYFFKKNGKVIKNIISSEQLTNVDINKINDLKKEYIKDSSLVLGNISRFEEKKNQDFIVDVFKDYLKINPKATLVLGGPDGGTLQTIKNKVKALNISNNVVFIGERDDVNLWLHIFDVYLFPSLYEGFGIVGLESQVCGTSVIASQNIPSFIDLELGLINFVELEKNKWNQALINFKRIEIEDKIIKNALVNKGFENLNSLIDLYSNI